MWLSFGHTCYEKHLQQLFTHDAFIVVWLPISPAYRVTLASTAELSIFHAFPVLSTFLLKRKKKAGHVGSLFLPA